MTEQPESNEEMIKRLRDVEGTPEATAIMAELWKQNIRFVKYVVHKITGLSFTDIDFEDMTQQAYFGFRAAVYTYDPDKDIAFISYAGNHIEWELYRYYDQNGLTVRIPAYMRQRLKKCEKMKRQLEIEAGRSVPYEEVLKVLGLSPAAIARTLETLQKLDTVSLDRYISDDTDGATYLDMIASDEDVADNVLEQEWISELRKLIFSALQEIPEDAREIIIRHYFHGVSFWQMAKERNQTRQTIWNKQNAAFSTLRAGKHGHALAEFMPTATSFNRAKRLIKQDRSALERLQLNDTERNLLAL